MKLNEIVDLEVLNVDTSTAFGAMLKLYPQTITEIKSHCLKTGVSGKSYNKLMNVKPINLTNTLDEIENRVKSVSDDVPYALIRIKLMAEKNSLTAKFAISPTWSKRSSMIIHFGNNNFLYRAALFPPVIKPEFIEYTDFPWADFMKNKQHSLPFNKSIIDKMEYDNTKQTQNHIIGWIMCL